MSAPFLSLETRRFLAEDCAVNLCAFDHTRHLCTDSNIISKSGCLRARLIRNIIEEIADIFLLKYSCVYF